MASPDMTPFFFAVAQHLAREPQGTTFIAKLGLDPAIKHCWAALNLSKSKKMANILDLRPDLFVRFVTEKMQPKVALQPKGFECLQMDCIPPLDQATLPPSSSSVVSATQAAGEAASAQVLNLSPSQARLHFLRFVLDAVAARDGCVIDLPQLGSVPEVQQAWKAGGLDKKLKMSDVLRERPDLFVVTANESGSAVAALTEKGILAVQDCDVPQPDSSCPPPTQGTKKKSGSSGARSSGPYGQYGHLGAAKTAFHRSDPYSSGPRFDAPAAAHPRHDLYAANAMAPSSAPAFWAPHDYQRQLR